MKEVERKTTQKLANDSISERGGKNEKCAMNQCNSKFIWTLTFYGPSK